MDTKQNDLETAANESASSDEIRSDIRGTRRDMDQTLDQLGERLHPRHLLDDVLDLFRNTPEGSASRNQFTQTSKRVGRTVAAELKEHPLPALLIGAGLLWWIIDANTDGDDGEAHVEQRERGRRQRPRVAPRALSYMPTPPYEPHVAYNEPEAYAGEMMEESMGGTGRSMKDKAADMASAAGDKISGAVSAVGNKISDAASSVGETMSGAASSAGDKMADAGRSARRYSARGAQAVSRQASILGDRFREASDEYPLAVGGAFLAAGLLAGLLLPRTEKEDEWMGEASDELKEQTRFKAEQLAQRGKEAAVKTAGAALEEAEARGITPESLAKKTSRVVSEAVNAGKEAAREEGIAGGDMKEHAQAIGQAAAQTAREETEEAARHVTQ
jgi:Protein of unknown function (DUF3618)